MTTAFLHTGQLKDLTVRDPDGDKVGTVEQVWLDDRTGRPEWVTVKTGLFGMKETFVPLSGARSDGDTLTIIHAKSVVRDAPHVDADQHLDADEERDLYRHYGLHGETSHGTGKTGTAAAGTMRGDDELVRSEERLHVGTEEQEVGRARLRKVVVTENVATTVPVSHEEVRVVREPIRDGDPVRADIGEAETEVTLHAERPVVGKEKVAVERVRLETEKVTEQQEISEKVRKEQIEYDDGTGKGGQRGNERGRGDRRGPQH
ncbi:DUF2382 domain-containing protein [Streptomyces sp. SDr-06]|uniref:PRC and DUF2382 domain-containing protein n=1 Tax=Streptomyces sp. SDr-06 TaxID=2267702 RepID=UPI000DEB3393|nr:PRC and DUF2382 domain-containing protein [Streptomyces sp. SDr-06]RCH67803.1 DUF2382 domain-containing protein [Streptomyces sp. SDr-06]